MSDANVTNLSQSWQGINHITLVTGDLDATVAFYRDVLEMRVIFEAPANPHHGRHAMISVGGPGMGLHFFELVGAQIFRLPDGVPSKPEFLPGALQHIAITVADETAALALRDRLSARGVPITPILEPGRFAPHGAHVLVPGSERTSPEDDMGSERRRVAKGGRAALAPALVQRSSWHHLRI